MKLSVKRSVFNIFFSLLVAVALVACGGGSKGSTTEDEDVVDVLPPVETPDTDTPEDAVPSAPAPVVPEPVAPTPISPITSTINLESAPCTLPYAVQAIDDNTIVVACEYGSVHISENQGRNFSEVNPLAFEGDQDSRYFFDLAFDGSNMYICGFNNVLPNQYVWKWDLAASTIENILDFDMIGSPTTTFDNCGTLTLNGSTMIATELNGNDFALSEDAGQTWVHNDSSTFHFQDMISVNGQIHGTGGLLSDGRYFVYDATAKAFAINNMGTFEEGRSIVATADGTRLLIGGGGSRDNAYILYRDLAEQTLRKTGFVGTDLYRVEDIVCPKGDTCYALAQTTGNDSKIYVSTDKGLHWTHTGVTVNAIPYRMTATENYVWAVFGNGDLYVIPVE